MKNKALFLDRDGTIIRHVPYIKDPEKVELIPSMIKKMLEYQKKGFLIIVVTNQSGITRGLITKQQYEAVNRRMLSMLEKEGILISGVFMCPSHPDANDFRRKPNPGMLFEAAEKFDIDLAGSIMVGDATKDVDAGRKAGVGVSLLAEDFLKRKLL